MLDWLCASVATTYLHHLHPTKTNGLNILRELPREDYTTGDYEYFRVSKISPTRSFLKASKDAPYES